METRAAVAVSSGGVNDMAREPGALLRVGWGYDVDVELVLSKRNWSRILRGKGVPGLEQSNPS